ncbi:folliculin-interacting protein N-terminus-domain-containing protein [Paraphysoderma sedebokerense]|nr:folliculin-interacting protein N-terminus-domain-containing protein [Paraphysoderma sedebokerense]
MFKIFSKPQHSSAGEENVHLKSSPQHSTAIDVNDVRVLFCQETTTGRKAPLLDTHMTDPSSATANHKSKSQLERRTSTKQQLSPSTMERQPSINSKLKSSAITTSASSSTSSVNSTPSQTKRHRLSIKRKTSHNFDLISQMIFGSVPLSYKGQSTKLHVLKPAASSSSSKVQNQSAQATQILLTNLFSISLSELEWNATALNLSDGSIKSPSHSRNTSTSGAEEDVSSTTTTNSHRLSPSGIPIAKAAAVDSGHPSPTMNPYSPQYKLAARVLTRSLYAVGVVITVPEQTPHLKTFITSHFVLIERQLKILQETLSKVVKRWVKRWLSGGQWGDSSSSDSPSPPSHLKSTSSVNTSSSSISSSSGPISNSSNSKQIGQFGSYSLQRELSCIDAVRRFREWFVCLVESWKFNRPAYVLLTTPSKVAAELPATDGLQITKALLSNFSVAINKFESPRKEYLFSSLLTTFLSTHFSWMNPIISPRSSCDPSIDTAFRAVELTNLYGRSSFPSTEFLLSPFSCHTRVVVVGKDADTAPVLSALQWFLRPPISSSLETGIALPEPCSSKSTIDHNSPYDECGLRSSSGNLNVDFPFDFTSHRIDAQSASVSANNPPKSPLISLITSRQSSYYVNDFVISAAPQFDFLDQLKEDLKNDIKNPLDPANPPNQSICIVADTTTCKIIVVRVSPFDRHNSESPQTLNKGSESGVLLNDLLQLSGDDTTRSSTLTSPTLSFNFPTFLSINPPSQRKSPTQIDIIEDDMLISVTIKRGKFSQTVESMLRLVKETCDFGVIPIPQSYPNASSDHLPIPLPLQTIEDFLLDLYQKAELLISLISLSESVLCRQLEQLHQQQSESQSSSPGNEECSGARVDNFGYFKNQSLKSQPQSPSESSVPTSINETDSSNLHQTSQAETLPTGPKRQHRRLSLLRHFLTPPFAPVQLRILSCVFGGSVAVSNVPPSGSGSTSGGTSDLAGIVSGVPITIEDVELVTRIAEEIVIRRGY